MVDNEIVVTEITVALFIPEGRGKPIHKNRPAYGLAFNVGCTVSYTFDDGKELLCHDGECIFLPKGSNYTVKRCYINESRDSGVYAINFLTISDRNMNVSEVIKIKGKNEMHSLFSKSAKAWLKKGNGYREECFSCLYGIIKQIKKENEFYYPKQKIAKLLIPALKYIDENYTNESITVGHLARLCGVSEVHLRKTFQKAFSVPPSVYIRNKRINYAKELLSLGEYSVTDIAMTSGFNDVAYFIREFKKSTGSTPTAYRKESK